MSNDRIDDGSPEKSKAWMQAMNDKKTDEGLKSAGTKQVYTDDSCGDEGGDCADAPKIPRQPEHVDPLQVKADNIRKEREAQFAEASALADRLMAEVGAWFPCPPFISPYPQPGRGPGGVEYIAGFSLARYEFYQGPEKEAQVYVRARVRPTGLPINEKDPGDEGPDRSREWMRAYDNESDDDDVPDDDEFDIINKPKHYNSHPSGIEAIELTRHMAFSPGNAFKYVFRTELKDGLKDLEKAQYYLKDAMAYPQMIFLPSWGSDEDYKLFKIMNFENGARRDFFYSMKYQDLPSAFNAVLKLCVDGQP